MTKKRLNHKQKAYFIMGIIFATLLLLCIFVFFYKETIMLRPLNPLEGPIEILVVIIGLAVVGLGGVYEFASLGKGQLKSFAYDVGLRIIATGYLIAFLSALADYIGLGSHHKLPYFGPLQSSGVFLGEGVIAAGFIMMFLSLRY